MPQGCVKKTKIVECCTAELVRKSPPHRRMFGYPGDTVIVRLEGVRPEKAWEK